MKKFSVLLVIAILLFTFCSSPQEMVENAKDKVKETAEKAADKAQDMQEEAPPVTLDKETVKAFFSATKKLNEKYEGVEFESPLVAAAQLAKDGKNLEKIINDETGMTFEEYAQMTTDIVSAEVEYQGMLISRDMYNTMENSYEKALAEKETMELDPEQMKEYEKGLEDLKNSLDKMDAKMAEMDQERIESNHKIIEQAKEECGI